MPGCNSQYICGTASNFCVKAWEKHVHKNFLDPESWFQTIYQPQTFSDGTPAKYHYGMLRGNLDGVDYLGHSGGLRDYRVHHRHAPNDQLSVIAIFNHEAGVSEAVNHILRNILNKSEIERTAVVASSNWAGIFIVQDTQLAITVAKRLQEGEIIITYAGSEIIRLTDATNARSQSMVAAIDGDNLRIHRLFDNRRLNAHRLVRDESATRVTLLLGDYECEEIQSIFH